MNLALTWLPSSSDASSSGKPSAMASLLLVLVVSPVRFIPSLLGVVSFVVIAKASQDIELPRYEFLSFCHPMLLMLMSLVRAFAVFRSPSSRCAPHVIPCTAVMANHRLATLCSHISAGAESTRRSPDIHTPKLSTFKCPNGVDIFTKVGTWAHESWAVAKAG